MRMKYPGDSFSGIHLCFRWHLGINSFWRQLGSLLELFRWHLRINSVWSGLGSPLGFAIPVDSFSGISPCFPLLGFTLLICSWGSTFSPVGGLLLVYFLGEIHSCDEIPLATSSSRPSPPRFSPIQEHCLYYRLIHHFSRFGC